MNLQTCMLVATLTARQVPTRVIIVLTTLQSMLVVKLGHAHPERAVRLDRMSRWLFPLGYAGIIAAIAIIHMG